MDVDFATSFDPNKLVVDLTGLFTAMSAFGAMIISLWNVFQSRRNGRTADRVEAIGKAAVVQGQRNAASITVAAAASRAVSAEVKQAVQNVEDKVATVGDKVDVVEGNVSGHLSTLSGMLDKVEEARQEAKTVPIMAAEKAKEVVETATEKAMEVVETAKDAALDLIITAKVAAKDITESSSERIVT